MAKEGMGLGDIISNAFKEYKANWKKYLGILIVLSFIPTIIYFILEILWMKQSNYSALLSKNDFSGLLSQLISPLGILFIVFGIIIFFIGILLQAVIVNYVLNKKKPLGLMDSISSGGKYFWRFFGIILVYVLLFVLPVLIIIGIVFGLAFFGAAGNILLTVVLALILILAIVGYIILILNLGVKWAFAFYIAIAENKSVMDSFRKSKEYVVGRWWKTLGYLIVIGLIIAGISILFSIPSTIISLIASLRSLGSANSIDYTSNLSIFSMIISLIFSMLGQIITVPLSVILGKNLYVSWKTSKK